MSDENNIPAGYYDAVCTGEVQYGEGTKGKQLAIQLQIPAVDRAVWSTLSFSDAAKKYSLEKLEACGWDGGGAIEEAIKGNSVRVGVSYEEYEGKMRMKVNIFSGGGFKFKNEVTGDAKTAFMNELRASMPQKPQKPVYPKSWDTVPADAPEKKGGFSLE